MAIVSIAKSKAAEFSFPRPLNCDFETSLDKRCKYCGQNHLRSGYCQALDPMNAGKYPEVLSQLETEVETQRSDETQSETELSGETQTGTCIECDVAFQKKTKRALFCSPTCRLKSYRKAKA